MRPGAFGLATSGLLFLAAVAFAAPKAAPPATPAVPPAAQSVAAASAALDAGDADGALRLLVPVLKKEPRNALALLLRSTAECMLGDLEPCRKDLDQALKLDPSLRQGWLNRSALAIAEERWSDALAALAKAEALDPNAADNAINQGAVHLLSGDLERATAKFRAHLERTPGDANDWYLVASNYASAGYSALAIEHLARAIGLDERSRVRAKADANFAELGGNKAFQQLLATDSWRPPAGTVTAERRFPSRLSGHDAPIVTAVLNVLQLSGAPLDPRIEVTSEWALFWAQYRIKLVRNADDSTTVRLYSVPEHYFAATWQSSTTDFFQQVEMQLLRLELSAGREPTDEP
jgi:tetratricopeptide (TPR) repeat protein